MTKTSNAIDYQTLPSSDWFINELFEEFSDENDTISVRGVQKIITAMNSDSHEDDHTDHDHSENLLIKTGESNTQKCYSASDLFSIFNFDDRINKKNFTEMSPSLVWVAIENVCTSETNNSNGSSTVCNSSIAQRYLFGSVAMITLWIVSMTSIITISLFQKNRNIIILSLNALAAGTLLSDALLHIIPKALGLHDHGEEGDGHGHEKEVDPQDVTWKMSAILLIIFLLMLLDCFGGGHSHDHEDKEHDHGHGHGHGNNSVIPEESTDDIFTIYDSFSTHEPKDNIKKHDLKDKKKQKKFLELFRGTGFIIFLANLIHKLADGLVIGAAFTESVSLGLSTALAVLFHEIPHELGI